MPVLLRPDGAVQVGGIPPRRAGAAAGGLSPTALAAVLRTMRCRSASPSCGGWPAGTAWVTPLPSMNC
jgi:hypothetical protein